MVTKYKRVTFTPDPKTLVFLGLDPGQDGAVTSADAAGALALYADLFQVPAVELAAQWRPNVWALLADVLRDTGFPAGADELPPHLAVVAELERANRLRHVGEEHLLSQIERFNTTHEAARARADARVKDVCARLRGLTAVHGAAVLAGVRWHWAHRDEDKPPAEWWLPSERWKWFQAREKDRAKKAKPSPPTLFDDTEE